MLTRTQGALTAISDDQLKVILRLVYRGDLSCPFGRSDLLKRGLNAVAEEGDLLFGLDRSAVQAVISAALAERRVISTKLAQLSQQSPSSGSRSSSS